MGTATMDAAADQSRRYGPDPRSEWMAVDWREHQRWVHVAGRPVNVIEIGSGPPLVFVHGLAGSWQNWLENLPFFARTHRCVALDLPGFGASPMPAEDISIQGYGKIVDGLCDALDIDSTALVGHSMGGFISAEVAIAFGTRVKKLVLVGAAGISSENIRREPLFTFSRRLEAATAWFASQSEFVARRPRLRRATLAAVVLEPKRIPAPLAYEFLRGSGKPGFPDAFGSLTSYPIRDRLTKIESPTLIMWGRQDRLVPVRDADEYERLIPDARKVIYEKTGHTPQAERPARFNADVAEFLGE